MDVQEFVSQTLVQISRGVREAQRLSKDEGGIPIAPGRINAQPSRDGDQMISFDLEVAVVAGGEAGAEVASSGFLKVVGLDAAAKAGVSGEKATTQRVSFSVPMHFNANYVE